MCYKIFELINSLWNRKEKPQQQKEQISIPILQVGYGQGVIITKGSKLSTTYKILFNILLSSLIPYTDNINEDYLC